MNIRPYGYAIFYVYFSRQPTKKINLMQTIAWKGVMPAVTTKFTSEDQLDLNLFSKNIQAQLEAGVHGIILGGTLGEASTLSKAEKNTLILHTVQEVKNQVPVVINIAEQTTKDAVASAHAAQEAGAKGLMMLPSPEFCR